jgi:type II secretory pathway predicted ATPase ExeA
VAAPPPATVFPLNGSPKRLWLSGHHREALKALDAAIEQRQGVLLLTGEVGSGKTTLTRALLNGLMGTGVRVLQLPYPDVEPLELYTFLGDGLPALAAAGADVSAGFRRSLQDLLGQGQRALLVVDDAQTLRPTLFSELASLLETAQQVSEQPGFFNVLLVGSNHLEAILQRPEHAALAKLIRVRCQLLPLTPSQVAGYVWYHLGAAGLDSNWFTPDAVSEIASSSRGIPRLINIVGDRTVQAALAAGMQSVDAPFVRQCRGGAPAMAVPELPEPEACAEDAEAQDVPQEEVADPDRRWRLLRVGAVAAVGVVLALGLLAYMGPRSAPLDAGTAGAGKTVDLPARAPEPVVAPSTTTTQAISPAAVTGDAVRPPVKPAETTRSESAVATQAAAPPPQASASPNGDRPHPRASANDERPRLSTTPNGERPRAVVPEKVSAPPQVGASTPPTPAPERATVSVKPPAPESGASSASPPTAPSPPTTTDDRDPSAIVDWLLQQRRPE